jgi:hypothetical protein
VGEEPQGFSDGEVMGDLDLLGHKAYQAPHFFPMAAWLVLTNLNDPS